MADASVNYPLMVRRRRRKLRVPRLRLGPHARLIFVGLASLGVVMAGVYLATRPAPVPVAVHLATARANLEAGNHNAARSNAQAAIRTDGRSAEAHLLLGRAFLRLEDGPAALTELRRARELGATVAPGAIAHARLLSGDAAGALEEAEALADPYAARVRALALAATGKRGQALADLQELVRAHSADADAWTALGRMLFSGGEVLGADVAASRAATLKPREPAALTLKGELVRSRFGPVASLPWFETALASDAYHYPALIEYAATLGEVGRNRDMLAATRAALLARPGSAQALYLQAVLAARAGELTLARAMLAHAGGAVRGIPGALLLEGAIDHAAGKQEQAIGLWRALLKVQPMNLTVRRLLGAALLRSGDAAGALETLRPAAVRADADPYLLTLAARGFEAAGDRARAAELLDRAARGNAGVAPVFASVESPAALAAAAARTPADPTYAVGLIRGLATAGSAGDAVSVAERLARETSGAPPAHVALGDAHAARGDWRRAVESYRRAADLRFDEPTMLRLVDATGRAGRAQDAAATLSLYLSQNPQSVTGQRLLGRWQLTAGDADAAIETLERVRARVGAGDAGLLAELAQAYAADGEGVVARRYAQAAYALAPMTPVAVAAYAAALEADSDEPGARQLRAKLDALRRP
jgi:tetratricopeptide (TPR) repeat protein